MCRNWGLVECVYKETENLYSCTALATFSDVLVRLRALFFYLVRMRRGESLHLLLALFHDKDIKNPV